MSLAAVTALLVFTLASPGPVDRTGGHVDIMDGRFHSHAGPAYQSRYLDLSGRMWTGQGPRPEEYLIFSGADNADLFGDTWFFFLAGSFVVASVVLGLDISKRLGYLRYHRRVHARDHERPVEVKRARIGTAFPTPVPSYAGFTHSGLVAPAVAQPRWQGAERRRHLGERRRHVRLSLDPA
jgi:hypothetical protein